MKIHLLDFQAEGYPEWAKALEKYRQKYPGFFDYRIRKSDDLNKWLADANIIFYHYGERELVEPLLNAKNPETPRRLYVVFSGGGDIGVLSDLNSTTIPNLLQIGRTGLANLLPRELERVAESFPS